MDASWIRDLCLSFPSATEHMIWENDLTFKVGGKMFAHTALEPGRVWLSFKATPENFFELIERPNIIPAPYLARAKWVALETKDALSSAELSALIRESYELIVSKLPKKTRDSLSAAKTSRSKTRRPHKYTRRLWTVANGFDCPPGKGGTRLRPRKKIRLTLMHRREAYSKRRRSYMTGS